MLVSLSYRFFVLALILATPTYAESLLDPKTETEEQDPIELPSFLIAEPFKVSSQMTIHLDGSEQAAGIERTSTTMNRVSYVSPEGWRVRREFPFTQNIREFIRTKEGFFALTPGNRKIIPRETPGDRAWQQIIMTPYLVARQWSLPYTDSDWSTWFRKIQEATEPMVNVEGDSLKVSVETEDGVKKTSVSASGVIVENGTKININLQWTIERGDKLKVNLEDSLLGGA